MRPNIVCLCGSTRFYDTFQRANYEETMKGNIVLSVGFYLHSAGAAHGSPWACTDEQKVMLDELHFAKIDLADEVLILNVDGYIGPSTKRELAYAIFKNKLVRFLEAEAGENFQEALSKSIGRMVAAFMRGETPPLEK